MKTSTRFSAPLHILSVTQLSISNESAGDKGNTFEVQYTFIALMFRRELNYSKRKHQNDYVIRTFPNCLLFRITEFLYFVHRPVF
jgi:hypothetical protein